MRFHRANVLNLLLLNDRMGAIASPEVHNRSDLVGKCIRNGHHSKYHRFFSQSAWQFDMISKVLATLVIHLFVPTNMIEVAVVDNLCRKRGLTLYGAGMHHDHWSKPPVILIVAKGEK